MLGTSSKVTTLKISFLSNLIVSFCLDTIYYVLVSLLINISNSSITKQVSDWDAIFTSPKYILGHLQLGLTEVKDNKDVDIPDIYIGGLSIEEASAGPFSIADAFIDDSTELSSIG